MCESRPSPPNGLSYGAPAAPPIPAPATGSRRRRLWELDSRAFCPVIGVCLPMALLRRLAGKTQGRLPQLNAYEVHCLAVTECRHRSALAEAIQKELDQRYALVLRAAQPLKSVEALGRWWEDCHAGADWAGALWATLTHPRCDAALEQQVLGEVHMMQHQVGASSRADMARLDALQEENAILARELAGAQNRSQQQVRGFGERLAVQQASVLRLRAELIQAHTRIQQLQDELAVLQAQHPDLPQRLALVHHNRQLQELLQGAQHELAQTRAEARTQAERILTLQSRAQPTETAPAGDAAGATVKRLDGQAVLCVGGRTASVPVYRELIEHRGARFLHHDGGAEDHSSLLDTTLAAADLVICQSGCISHNAYWRVKDHCKRTGKRCIFVETPSRSALERALSDIGTEAPCG
jgi:phage shock protein A